MTDTKFSFQRYEKKYLLSREKYQALWQELAPLAEPDCFFRSTVCSVYYDWEDFRLIRHSLDRPAYKEKLRLRSYNVPGPADLVFVELKKKYEGVVYKRRVAMPAGGAEAWLVGAAPAPDQSQISREIDWFLRSNLVRPQVLIACDRQAYTARENGELRFTFDSSIRWRDTDLSLTAGDWGRELLSDGQVLMEIKLPGAAPLWLAHMLSRLEVFPRGFSKYGQCYQRELLEKNFYGVMNLA